MKIGILQAGHLSASMQEKYGDLDEVLSKMLQGHGFEIDSYRVCDNQFPESVSQAQGWLVSGSVNSANDDLAWIWQLKDFIRQSYRHNIPLVGICFGHQVIASALGGTVEKYSGGWGVGNHQYQMADSTFKPRIIAFHQDQVIKKPAAAKCIGGSAFCENAFLVYGEQVFSMQPHPEFSTDYAKDLLADLSDLFSATQRVTTEKSFAQPIDSVGLHRSIANFFKTQKVVITEEF